MLMIFDSEAAKTADKIVCLDQYRILVSTKGLVFDLEEKLKTVKEIQWKHPCCINLQPPSDKTAPLYFYFFTEREAERWAIKFLNAIKVGEGSEAPPLNHLISTVQSSANSRVHSELTIMQVILSRVFAINYETEPFVKLIRKKIEKKIEKTDFPPFVEQLIVKEVYFGPNLPEFRNIQLLDITELGGLSLNCDLLYCGGFSVLLELVISFAQQVSFLQLPTVTVRVRATTRKVEGKMRIEISDLPGKTAWVSFLEEPDVQLDIDTEITAGESSTHNVPQVANIAISQMKKKIIKAFVFPNMESIPLPVVKDKDLKKLKAQNPQEIPHRRRESLQSQIHHQVVKK